MSKYDKNVGFVEGLNKTSEDEIFMAVEATGKTQVTVSLIAGPNISWWKGIKTGQWEMLSSQDDRVGPNLGNYPMSFLQDNKGNSIAKVCKAKGSGIHTPMYDLMVKNGFKLGYHYTFTWLKD